MKSWENISSKKQNQGYFIKNLRKNPYMNTSEIPAVN